MTEPFELKLLKAESGELNDRWTMTAYTKEFHPIKKSMRDFLMKQRAVEKQMEKFCQAALYKRGIFGTMNTFYLYFISIINKMRPDKF